MTSAIAAPAASTTVTADIEEEEFLEDAEEGTLEEASSTAASASTLFPFLLVNDIHPRLQSTIAGHLAKLNAKRKAAKQPSELPVLASRKQICSNPQAATQLIESAKMASASVLFLLDIDRLHVEVIHLTPFGEETIRSCGKRSC